VHSAGERQAVVAPGLVAEDKQVNDIGGQDLAHSGRCSQELSMKRVALLSVLALLGFAIQSHALEETISKQKIDC
jgi:hypothetical protein